jgi:hypothetical protein
LINFTSGTSQRGDVVEEAVEVEEGPIQEAEVVVAIPTLNHFPNHLPNQSAELNWHFNERGRSRRHRV